MPAKAGIQEALDEDWIPTPYKKRAKLASE